MFNFSRVTLGEKCFFLGTPETKSRRAPSFPKAPFIVSMAISRILSVHHFASKMTGVMIIHLIRPACAGRMPSPAVAEP